MAFLGSYFLCRLADDLVAPAQLIWVTALHQQSYGVPPPTWQARMHPRHRCTRPGPA